MLDFKTKLRQEIVEPDRRNSTTYSFSATAMPGNRTRGKYCKIKFENEKGETITAKGEISRIYGNDSTGGWYPKNNEKVLVEKRDSKYIIISSLIEDYESYIKNYELKSDVFSSIVTGSAPSVIY